MLTTSHRRVTEPTTPRGVRFKKKDEPFSTKDLQALIPFIIEVGVQKGYSVDYITDQIYRLVKENPTAAAGLNLASLPGGITGDYAAIKKMVSSIYGRAKKLGGDDPVVMNKDKNNDMIYGPVDGSLFVNGISANDIKQGGAGDCYFVSALSAVADANPQFLAESIIDHGNSTYSVRFFRDGKPTYVTVDGDLPRVKDTRPEGSNIVSYSLAYGSSTDEGELWVSIMEKAYAKMMGGYEKIGNGGRPEQVLEALTGSIRQGFSISSDKLYSELKKALKNGKPVTADTSDNAKKYAETGLVENHVYTVIDVKEVDGKKYVVLRNPWGNDGRNGWAGQGVNENDDGANGIFMMPIKDFQKLFEHVYTIKTAPQPYSPTVLDDFQDYLPSFPVPQIRYRPGTIKFSTAGRGLHTPVSGFRKLLV